MKFEEEERKGRTLHFSANVKSVVDLLRFMGLKCAHHLLDQMSLFYWVRV